jgi:hypothetical protein
LQQLFGLVFVNVHQQGAAVSSPPPLGFRRQTAIACRRQIGKDFSAANWLAS